MGRRRSRADVSTLEIAKGMLRDSLYCFLLIAVVIDAGSSTIVHPYLMFSTHESIYKHILNGSTSYTEQVLTPPSFGILGLTYHLRLDTIFWINDNYFSPSIMTARLDGSDVQELVHGDLGNPADLAVDWLNDRLYWVDRSRRQILEYDLNTAHQSVALSTGDIGESNPSALALFPYPNYGWVYWSDGNKLQRASVTGDDRATLRSNLVCVNVLAIDYASVSIYWIDHCLYEIQSLRLDGDAATHSYPFSTSIFFASGLAIHNYTFYWSDQDGVFERGNSSESMVITIYDAPLGTRATGVQLIHASLQPDVDDFIEIIAPENTTSAFECLVDCVNGACIPPGLCGCSVGWRGASCDTDVNECERQNGGCEHQCVNNVGSFLCICSEGYTLADDGLTCEVDLRTSTTSVIDGTYSPTAIVEEIDKSQSITTKYSLIETAKESISATPIIKAITSSPVNIVTTIPSVYITSTPSAVPLLPEHNKTDAHSMTTSPVSTLVIHVSRTLVISDTNIETSITSQQQFPSVYFTSAASYHDSTFSIVKPTKHKSASLGIMASSQVTKVTGGNRKTSRPSLLSSALTSIPPSYPPTINIIHSSSSLNLALSPTPRDRDVDIAPSSRDKNNSTAIIIATVLTVTVSLIIVIVVLVVIIVMVRKNKSTNGSFTPEQQQQPQNTSMKFNLSVKRIISTLSYASKT